MKELLFTYGTLQDPAVQKKIIGRIVTSEPDTLTDHATEEITLLGEIYPIFVDALDKNVGGRTCSECFAE